MTQGDWPWPASALWRGSSGDPPTLTRARPPRQSGQLHMQIATENVTRESREGLWTAVSRKADSERNYGCWYNSIMKCSIVALISQKLKIFWQSPIPGLDLAGVSLLSWPGVIRCDIKYSNARQIPNCRNEHNINIRTLHTHHHITITHSSSSADVTSIFVPTFYWLNHCKYWCFSVDWLT